MTGRITTDAQIFDVFLKNPDGRGTLLVDGEPHEVFVDDDRRLRFRGNPIVIRLFGERPRGFLNEIDGTRYTKAQFREFFILIGYTLSGFLELAVNADVELRLP